MPIDEPLAQADEPVRAPAAPNEQTDPGSPYVLAPVVLPRSSVLDYPRGFVTDPYPTPEAPERFRAWFEEEGCIVIRNAVTPRLCQAGIEGRYHQPLLAKEAEIIAFAAAGIDNARGIGLDQCEPFEHAAGDLAAQELRLGHAQRLRKQLAHVRQRDGRNLLRGFVFVGRQRHADAHARGRWKNRQKS